jgi:hypothetical protein
MSWRLEIKVLRSSKFSPEVKWRANHMPLEISENVGPIRLPMSRSAAPSSS